MGSVERPLGILAMLAGDLEGAAAHFERALEANVAIGAPLALANARRRVRRAAAAARRPR